MSMPQRSQTPPEPSTPGGRTRQEQLLMDVVSTVIMAGFLWWRLGPMVAFAVMVGIFVHEYGHVLAMNRLGCGPARFHIVPFVGGAAYPARPASTEFQGVLISLAGPVFGLLAAIPFIIAAAMTGQLIWVIGGLAVAGLNLINLAPAPPLDGSKALGPALARIHPMLEKGALVLVGAVGVLWAIATHNWIFGLFIAIGVAGAFRRDRLRPWALKLTKAEWGYSIGLYLGALVLCLLTAWASVAVVGISPSPLGLLALLGLA
ncbi:MAG: peptidase M50 [Proteobacteria bacterium]|nr:peptidase M50 [Pseudomonadota bacterium]